MAVSGISTSSYQPLANENLTPHLPQGLKQSLNPLQVIGGTQVPQIPPASEGGAHPLAQAFAALGQALQSGNLADAQKAYSALQQDIQERLGSIDHTPNGNPPSGAAPPGSAGGSGHPSGPVVQAFLAMGQALQSGDLAAAQKDFATIQDHLAAVHSIMSASASSPGSSVPPQNGANLNVSA